MLVFFRHLMVFLLGALVGAVAILFFLPTFSATFSNASNGAVANVKEPAKPAEPVAKVEEPAKPAEPVAKTEEPAKPTEPVAKVEEPAKPAEEAPPEPAAAPETTPAVPGAEPAAAPEATEPAPGVPAAASDAAEPVP